MSGYPTIPPSQLKAELMNSRMARNPIKLAVMLATSPTDSDAPAEAASRIFCSPLIKKNRQIVFWAQMSHYEHYHFIFFGNSPAFYDDIVIRFKLALFSFWIWEFGHGQCTWSSHYRGSDQRGCINLWTLILKSAQKIINHEACHEHTLDLGAAWWCSG